MPLIYTNTDDEEEDNRVPLFDTTVSGMSPPPVPVARVHPSDRIFTKSPADIAIDTQEVQVRARRLAPFSDHPILALTGMAKLDHDALSSLGKIIHHVPDAYAHYYDVVTRVFPIKTYAPGTVGAYYTSCLASRTADEACALPCIGSLPRPGVDACSVTVFFARWDGTHLVYERVYTSEAKGRALVYVPNGIPFYGIPASIVAGMQESMGIMSVRIVVYDPTTGAPLRPTETPDHLSEALEGFVPIQTVVEKRIAVPMTKAEAVNALKEKIKASLPPPPASASTSPFASPWLVVLLVVVILALIAALIYAVVRIKRTERGMRY